MDLTKLSLGDKILAATGILLIIDLLFLPWHKIEVGFGAFKASASRSGLESPNSFWGILAFLLALAIVAVVVLSRLTTVKLPELPIAWGQALFFASIAALAFLVIKLIAETDFLGFGAWLGIILAAGMVYGGFLRSKEPEVAAGGATGDPII